MLDTRCSILDSSAGSPFGEAGSAILFLYRHVLKTEIDWFEDVVRARQPRHLPNVLSREEVAAILSRLEGTAQLIVLQRETSTTLRSVIPLSKHVSITVFSIANRS